MKKMMKRLAMPALALASLLAMAAPNVTLAAQRGNNRAGGNQASQQDFRGGGNQHFGGGNQNFNRGGQSFDRGGQNFNYGGQNFDRGGQNFDRGGRNFDRYDRHFDRGDRDDDWGVGVYAAPAPVIAPTPSVAGYYDQYGVWQPYGYYDQFGVWHSY
jgi:hypothetical protein